MALDRELTNTRTAVCRGKHQTMWASGDKPLLFSLRETVTLCLEKNDLLQEFKNKTC